MGEEFKLHKLFWMFAVNYRNLWTDAISQPEAKIACQAVWSFALREFDEKLVLDAAMRAISQSDVPPKVSEIVEIAKSIRKGKEPVYQHKMLKSPIYRQPVSPFLAEYMKANGIQDDSTGLSSFLTDPAFVELREKHQGASLGKALLAEICRRVRKNHEKSG